MKTSKYEEILKTGERTEWHGIEVPKDLLTNSVIIWSEGLKQEIDKLESSLSDLKGSELEKRKGYLKALYNNLLNAPYKLNGDIYLMKKDRVEKEIEELNKDKKVIKEKKKITKTTKEKEVKVIKEKVTRTKNSDLIFGKK